MRRILASVDFSPITPRVLDQAVELATATASELWVLHVGAPDPDFAGHQLLRKVVEGNVPEALASEHQQLLAIEKDLRRSGVEVRTRLVRGEPVRCILEEARIVEADCIVLGSHGHGALYRVLAGSVCEGVLRGTQCPLVIIPRPGTQPGE